jgi:hypothetical protein
MSHTLNCPTCGASSEPEGTACYVTCSYCASSISVVEFFRKSSSDNISSLSEAGFTKDEMTTIARLIDKVTFNLEISDFKNAKLSLSEVLAMHPQHLPSRFNLALCMLYSGEATALERAKQAAKTVLAASQEHEMIPELLVLRNSIAYNIASVAIAQSNTYDTIAILNESYKILQVHSERDVLVYDFYQKVFQNQFLLFNRELKIKKKKYIPNQTLLNVVLAGAPYNQDLCDFGGTILLLLDEKISLFSSTRAENAKIINMMDEFREVVYANCSDKISKVNFGMFGVNFKAVNKQKIIDK